MYQKKSPLKIVHILTTGSFILCSSSHLILKHTPFRSLFSLGVCGSGSIAAEYLVSININDDASLLLKWVQDQLDMKWQSCRKCSMEMDLKKACSINVCNMYGILICLSCMKRFKNTTVNNPVSGQCRTISNSKKTY